MKQYPSYKDSGVVWIGEIPKGWEMSKMKYHFHLYGGFPFSSETITNEETEYPIIRIGNVTSGKVDVYYSGVLDEKIPLVNKGDYILSLTGDFNIRKWENKLSLLNQRCGKLVGLEGVNTRYSYYILPFHFNELEQTKYFTTLKNLSNSEVLDLQLPLPPLSEQQQIVSYLDEKTSQIDTLIQTKKRKIGLLKEYRTSLINEVVTKGLNPDVEMKDSGVEWIGEIPKGWEVSKFKYHSEIVTGNTPTKSREDEFYTTKENGFPWIKPTSLDKGFNYVYDSEEYLSELGKTQTRIIPKDSVMVCSIGNTLGKYGISGVELSTNQQINSVISDKVTLIPKYCLLFISVLTVDLIKWTNFVTLPIFTKSDFQNTEIIIPPLSEQQEIVSYLDEQTGKVDEEIGLEKRKIELLKNYRTSLISDVVTGKINVQDEVMV